MRVYAAVAFLTGSLCCVISTSKLDLPSYCITLTPRRHLRPLGHFEWIVLDRQFYSDEGPLPHDGRMMTWWRAIDKASRAHGRPLAFDVESMHQLLKTIGFTDVEQNEVRLPIRNTEVQCEQCRLLDKPMYASYLHCEECRLQSVLDGHYGTEAVHKENINAISNGLFAHYGANIPEDWSQYKVKLRNETSYPEEEIYNKL